MGKETIAPEVRVGESSPSSNGFSPHINIRPLRISVIICAYSLDRWDALVAAVQSSFGQTLRPAEVVVVIDHNDDLLGRATVEFPDALVIPSRGTKGLSGARNTGVAATTGDVIAFLDDDSFAEPDWLEQLTGPLTDPRIAGVGGWIRPKWEDGPARWLPESYYWVIGCSYAGLPSSQERLRNPIGANMALRRDIFTSVGGFTSGIGRIGKVPLGCEETELCIRYSAHFPDRRFIMVREAVVHHLVPASRLTWHYFWTRCWAEGLSKAAVSSLDGSEAGLSAERRYLVGTLPREFFHCLRVLPRHPRTATARATLIVIGAWCAFAGLIRGRIALQRHPIAAGGDIGTTLPSVEGSSDAPASQGAGGLVVP